MKYYAAVDKDGAKKVYKDLPAKEDGYWIGYIIMWGEHATGFPDITWIDGPVEVELSIKAVKV